MILLDQRDQLAADLGQLVDIKIYEQDDRFSITIGNGQTVLGGDSVYHLQVQPSAADPGRMAVNYTVIDATGNAQPMEMQDKLIAGGKLGGLLTFRTDVLDVTQNDLGRLSLGISMSMNAQHSQGYDPSGAKGADFFFASDGLWGQVVAGEILRPAHPQSPCLRSRMRGSVIAGYDGVPAITRSHRCLRRIRQIAKRQRVP
ncbi:FlgK family flagellar hook-associated protein [Castellaniella sp.]|uniref:FlgK family flagellar hook-associated protein n=1 Tax=Castellaniella sp. TaxID=1955812 RepID=UPI002AFF51BA|nr:hypothetical protein [Castellaniella sp.]